MNPALFVIDMQKQFFAISPAVTQSLKEAVEYINAAIALFREKNLPIIVIEHKDEEYDLVPGAPDFGTHGSIALEKSDPRIVKTYGNAFTKTDLAERLRTHDVDTVILTGFAAEHCVLATYQGAKDRDLTPIVLRGSLASETPERIRFVEEITDIVSFNVLKKMVAG
jgi:nicotinamidase-related amidase